MQLAKCADMYMAPTLVRLAFDLLGDVIDNGEVDSCRLVLSKIQSLFPHPFDSDHPQLKSLLNSCVVTIAKCGYPNTTCIKDNFEMFLGEPFGVVQHIVGSNFFRAVSEVTLVYYVILWAQHNMANEADLEKWFGHLIYDIQFGSMCSGFLSALGKVPFFAEAAALASTGHAAKKLRSTIEN
eukprot:TRINITY_DN12379_c0_g1_i1.p2 TRINITY_DN12379_c0_g1~~TRINITY_DN12379_c0_g1_i1.p2  ORF type:complete len:182 (+),score=17.10 TRINITY_DN12379_c0_g1_i1:1063-1608(+)